MSNTETNYLKRPEGLTPLIFWEWLKEQPGRRIIHSSNPEDKPWRAVSNEFGGSYYHETAGGLAAQLKSFTSFREEEFSPYEGMTAEQKAESRAIQVRQMMQDGV